MGDAAAGGGISPDSASSSTVTNSITSTPTSNTTTHSATSVGNGAQGPNSGSTASNTSSNTLNGSSGYPSVHVHTVGPSTTHGHSAGVNVSSGAATIQSIHSSSLASNTSSSNTAPRHHRRGKSYEGTRGSGSTAAVVGGASAASTASTSASTTSQQPPSSSSLSIHAAGGDVGDVVSDASWQLLGWEHSSASSASSSSSIRISAADTILRALLADFSEHTQLKLEEIMKFGIDEKFFLWDIFEADPKMHQLITAMSELAKYHVTVVIDALLRWRSSRMDRVNAIFKSESQKSKPSRDASLMEERNRLAIEFLFCSAVLPILDCVGARLADMLKPELCLELENVAFLYFRAPSEGKNSVVGINLDLSPDSSRSTLDLNRKKIPTLYAKLLGTLSRFRLREIAPRFLKEITSNSVRSRKAVFVIQAIRFVKIQLPSLDGLELASMFVPALLELFKASQRFEVKSALAELVLRLLRPHILLSSQVLVEDGAPASTANPQSSVDAYNNWFKLVLEMFSTKAFHYKKKPKVNKELLVNQLMKTAFMVALKRSDFVQHFWPTMLQFLDLLKESKATAAALECILVLLEAYLLKCGDSPNEPVDQRLDEISSQVFTYVSAKRSSSVIVRRMGKGDPADIFVDIICVIARARLKFAMENIIFKMLSVSGKDQFQAERVMVAVLAAREIWTAAAEHRPLQVSKSRLKGDAPQAATPSMTAANQIGMKLPAVQLAPYVDPVAVAWWQLLTHLDNMYGNLLYSTHSKPLLDLIRPEKDGMAIELLRTTIFSIPIIMPKTDDQRLVRLLSKYLIHLDRGIGEMATGALSRLMADRPHFRPLIIQGVSEFVLAIPHNRHDLVFTLLFKLGQLLKRWVEILKTGVASAPIDGGAATPENASAQHQLDTFSIDKVEGTALIFLCSPRAKIRLLALEILRSVRAVEAELVIIAGDRSRDSAPARPSIRVMDILDEVGSDIFKFLQKEQTSFLKTALAQPLPLTVKTLERLAARESKEDQVLWCHALAELLRYVSFSHPAPALYACSLVLARFQALQPEDSDPRLFTVEQEEMACWWRNYIVFACATIPLKLSHQLFKHGLVSALSTTPSSVTPAPPPTSSSSGGVVSFIASGVSAAVGFVAGSSSSSSSTQGEGSDGFGGSPEGGRDTPTTIKELLSAITPLLKSSSEVHREASVLALQRTNAACYEALFISLRPFEKEFFGDYDKKKKTKRDRLRMEIMSIYTHIAEYARPGTLVANPIVKASFVAFAQDTVMFFATNKNMFEHVSLRYQFTILARRLAEELHSARGEGTFEDDHLRKTLFYVFKKWCGPEVINDEATRKHLNTVLSAVKDPEKRQAYVTALRQHVLAVQLAAFQAMTACLLGPHFEAILPSDSFFPFIHSFLKNSHERVRYLARLMLEAFLQGNLSQPHVLQITLNYCFSSDPDIASNYFLCLVELFPEERLSLHGNQQALQQSAGVSLSPLFTVLLHLVVYMMGDSDYVVRRNAHELLLLIKSLSGEEDRWQNVPFVIESSLHENYERAQLDLSFRLADAHGDAISPEFVHEMVSRLDSVAPRARRQMLRYALPWLAKLDLTRLSRSTLDVLLYDLLMVTLKFESELRSEAEQIWSQLAARVSNLPILINKLLQIGIDKQNPDFIPLAKLICVYCARRSPKAVVDALVAELSSSSQSELADDVSPIAPSQSTNVVAAISVAAALLDGRDPSTGAEKPDSPRSRADVPPKYDPLPTTEDTVSINVPQKRRVLRRALSSRESSRSERVVSTGASNTFVKSPSAGLAPISVDDSVDFHGAPTALSGPPSISSSPSSAPLQLQSPLAAAVAMEAAGNVDDEYGGGSGPVSPRDEYASDYSTHRRGSVDAIPSGAATPGGWATSDDESSQQQLSSQQSHPFHKLIASIGMLGNRSSKTVLTASRAGARKPPISRSHSPANRTGAQVKRAGINTPHGRHSREEDEFSRSAETDTISATASSGQQKGRPFVEEAPESASDGTSDDSSSESEPEGRSGTASTQSSGALPSPASAGVDNESSDDSMDEEYLRHRRQRNRADSDVSATFAPESSAASRRGTLALDSTDLVDGGWGLTRGHFTLVILAQLTYETSQCFREHLPIIFHLAFLGLDYRHVLVYEHCRIILLNVIHALVVVPLAAVVLSSPTSGNPADGMANVPTISASGTTPPSSVPQISAPSVEQHRAFEEGLELERFLKAHANKQLWTNEDIALKKTEIKSAQQVANLVTSIVSVLKGVGIDLAEAWATQALSWAVNCPSWHISGRSFQIYRALHPSMTRDAQNDLFECLLRTLATSRRNPRESLPQSIEILLTLQSLVKSMSSQKLILFPQLFWAAAALAQSDYEQHFFHASQLLLDLLERINFGDRYVQNVFGASVPKDWHPSFPGLQPLVLRGLFSEANEVKTVQLLSLLTLIPYNDLIHPEGGPLSRFMTNVLALLPYVCANYRTHSSASDATPQNSIPMTVVAERLSQAAVLAQRPQLAALFAKVARQPPEFGSVEEFLQELKIPLGRALQAESATVSSRRTGLTPEVAALSLLFSLLENGPPHWRKFLLTIIFNLLSFCVTSATAELEKLLQPRWVSTLLRMVSSSTWRQALPLVDLILQKSSLTVSQLTPEPNSPATVPFAQQPRFLNKPDKGIRIAATAVDKLLSTEQRRRMASIDRTVFSVFGSTSDVHRAAEEDKLTAEQQINYLLNATTASVMQPRGGAEDDQKSGVDGADMDMKPTAPMDDDASDDESEELDISAATLNKGTFGRFPTFRGFEELLAKLEALPNRSGNPDDNSDAQNRSPRQPGSESTSAEFSDGIHKPPSARRSGHRWDADESTDEETKGLSAAAYRRVKKKMRSSSGDVASVNRRNWAAISASGIDQPPRERPRSKVKALSARNSSQIRQYLSNDFDPDMPVALSPYSTMRKKLSFSFTETVLNATRHWRDVQHSSAAAALEASGGQALFDVFPAATKLVAALQDDYASSLPSFASLTSAGSVPQRLLASDSLRTDGNRLQGGFQAVPDTVLNLVITKYKRKLKRNPSFAQSFREQRAKLIEDINRLQMAYIEKRIVAEDARRDLALAAGASRRRQRLEEDHSNLDEFDQKTEDEELRKLRPLLEVSMTQAVVELHLTLLKLLKNHNRLKELVNDILQSDTDTADVQQMRSKLDDEVDANRKMATELRQLAQSQLRKREASK
eukprot:TRINITY_DN4599_c0_g1_i1.p1 TRINITY_DN4599_c0_g1~~TRINITY_DN4599_c0_g1_i1.p1  ORF type:complete len:3193 (+),score=542.19 TRINITY_DN4599_c0_g1_i1:78-9656(+)